MKQALKKKSMTYFLINTGY